MQKSDLLLTLTLHNWEVKVGHAPPSSYCMNAAVFKFYRNIPKQQRAVVIGCKYATMGFCDTKTQIGNYFDGEGMWGES